MKEMEARRSAKSLKTSFPRSSVGTQFRFGSSVAMVGKELDSYTLERVSEDFTCFMEM
jgi:hypothetical protein